jgi:hypothetical protein
MVSRFPYIESVIEKNVSIKTKKSATKYMVDKLKKLREDKNRLLIKFDPEKGLLREELAERCKKVEEDKTIPSWASFRRNKNG